MKKDVKIKVVALKSGRKCRHGHKIGDSYVLEADDCKGLCKRNKKFLLSNREKILEEGAFTCPDKAVSFEVF